jgi:arylsulfatase A-like enzyme
MKHILTLLTALLLTPPCLLGAADPFDRATIVGLMRQANDWQTAHPHIDRLARRGTVFANAQMPDTRSTDWAIAQLRENQPKPFALFLGLIRPHVPWLVPQPWFGLHPLAQVTLPPHKGDDREDLPEVALRFADLPMMPRLEWMQQEMRWEKSVQAYLACVSYVDHCVGRILDALEQSPHGKNTIVVLLSDHGYQLGEKGIWAKHTLWERSTRVPFIIARPNGRAQTTGRPVNHVDLYPTLLELAGLPPNETNDGRSLVRLLDDPDAPGFDASLTTLGPGNHTIRTERWRYIRYADGSEELYDHATDPHEWHNLVPGGGHTNVLAALRKHLPGSEAPFSSSSGILNHNAYFRELTKKRP